MILVPVSVGGKIQLKSIKSDMSKRILTPKFNNIILDTGLAQILVNGNYLDTCHVGRSDLPAIASQTSLIDPVAATNTRISANSITTTTPPYFGISQVSYRFPLGEITGIIREIGFGPSLVLGSDLFNRASIKDSFGNDSYTIVPNDEQLEVDYELTLSVPTTDMVGTIMYDGQEIEYTIRPAYATDPNYWCMYRSSAYASPGQAVVANFNTTSLAGNIIAYEGGIGTPVLAPGGNSSPARWVTNLPYVNGSFEKKIRAEWEPQDAVFENGIKSLLWFMKSPVGTGGGNTLGAYQIEFATPLMKTFRKGFRVDLGISWGRYDS